MNVLDLVRDNIKQMQPYSSARDEFKEFSKDLVFLDANENPFYNGVNRYPDPQQIKVKETLSSLKNIPVENILLGNGSDEVLDLIFRAFCEPKKDKVITLPPTYGMYQVLANLNDVETIKIPLDEAFQPKVGDILSVSESKVLFLCSPNNPTANSFYASRIEGLIVNYKGIIVIDEAYIDFSNEESWINRLKDFSNLIVTQTFSKAYGMAGIRLGVCYASKEIISILNKIKPPYNVNELTQQKAINGLLEYSNTLNEIKLLKDQRKVLDVELSKIDWVEKIFPSDANFLLVKVDDANKRYDQLIDKGIIVRNRTNQLGCFNCLRFTIGTKQENELLIRTIKNL